MAWVERAVTRECPYGLGDWDLRRFQIGQTRKGISEMVRHEVACASGALMWRLAVTSMT